jgi:CDP-4-dehydro-6-deoxyglucose reductase, E1
MSKPQYDMNDKRIFPAPDYWYPTAFSSWDDEEYEAIRRVVRSDRFTMGPEVEAFEREFAAWHGVKHGIMVNSGSSANLVMVATLVALGFLKRGDRVLVPAIAWSTTYAPLIQYGMRLLLEDPTRADWNARFGIQHLADCKVALFVPILGNAVGLHATYTDCGSHDRPLLVDNCESLGATDMHGGTAGTQGLMNSFSFFHSHQISAIEGGMVLTNSDECARMCRILRSHGWTRDVEKPESFEREYNFVEYGYNVRPTEIHAAIAREQLKRLNSFVELRRMNLRYFKHRVEQLEIPIRLQELDISHSSPFGLSFTTPKRAELVTALRFHSIDCRLPTGGSFLQHPYGPPYCEYHRSGTDLKPRTPVADEIHQTGLFLGNAPFDIQDKIEVAVQVMVKVLKS